MKNTYSYFLLALVLAGCVENKQQEQKADSTAQVVGKESVSIPAETTPVAPAKSTLPEQIIRERAEGTVQILDSVNGRPIAELNDNMQLEAGVPVKGWAPALITAEINSTQEKAQLIKKGQAIIADGKVAGKALQDIVIEMTFKNDKGVNTGVFHAAVQQQKIKAGSIIEIALSNYLKEHPGRTLADMQSFIKQFALEALDNNPPFKEYYNYESAADDPSPGYRTVLIFHQDKLIGVVDARSLKLENAKLHRLDRGYHGYFFNDTDAKLRQSYIEKFNIFVNSAD